LIANHKKYDFYFRSNVELAFLVRFSYFIDSFLFLILICFSSYQWCRAWTVFHMHCRSQWTILFLIAVHEEQWQGFLKISELIGPYLYVSFFGW